MEKCLVEWCNCKPNISGKGYCRMHYDQIRKYGHITNFRPKGKRNEYYIKDNYAELNILDKEGNIIVIALVDIEDVNRLQKYSFRYEKGKYIKTLINRKTIYLHQLVLGKEQDLVIDHINRNKLDNRKANLRFCTQAENLCNKEKGICNAIGVSISTGKRKKKYRATFNGVYLGNYKTIEEAIQSRINYELLKFGKVISINKE